ncbi:MULTISPECIES: Fic family protein [unclassified Natrinema]|uniref:Fic family protein n=1 Tax=unclassified Natrinema TaxID=2622230 RepID=UPI00026D5020|nr:MULTISPECIES: Fic family protein [unclassified Natrinema]AFO59478.1 hypothetical protein NJ7G_4263 [Natrinema sp. J7-2]
MSSDELPTVDEIHDNHDVIVDSYQLDNPGVDDPFADRKLEEILSDSREYEDITHRASVLLREIAAAHIYADGNKRTALITTVEYLDRHGMELHETNSEKITRVMRSLSRFQIAEIAHWIETGSIDDSRLQ